MRPNPDAFNKKLVRTAKIIGIYGLSGISLAGIIATYQESKKFYKNSTFNRLCWLLAPVLVTIPSTYYLGKWTKDLYNDLKDYLKKNKLMKQNSDNQLLESQ